MLTRRTATNGVVYYASERFDSVGVRHAFATRCGGVSAAPFDTLNLGNPGGCPVRDSLQNIERNYALLLDAIGCRGYERCRVDQVHGDCVREVYRGRKFPDTDGDAIVSDDPERAICVRVADCVPILLARRDGRFVAAVHSGWRGVIANVTRAAVEALCRRSGADPSCIIAAIGPCIGSEAFEVGGEVLAAFCEEFRESAPISPRADAKGHVDLRRGVELQLLDCGLEPRAIDVSDRCTYRDADEFFSHRRENGRTGRHAAVIAARA